MYIYDSAPDIRSHVYESFYEVAMLMSLELATGLAALSERLLPLMVEVPANQGAAHQIKSVWELSIWRSQTCIYI